MGKFILNEKNFMILSTNKPFSKKTTIPTFKAKYEFITYIEVNKIKNYSEELFIEFYSKIDEGTIDETLEKSASLEVRANDKNSSVTYNINYDYSIKEEAVDALEEFLSRITTPHKDNKRHAIETLKNVKKYILQRKTEINQYAFFDTEKRKIDFSINLGDLPYELIEIKKLNNPY